MDRSLHTDVSHLVAIGLGQRHEARRGEVARTNECVGVILDAQPVDGGQLVALDGAAQQVGFLVGVADAIESGLAGVDLDPAFRTGVRAQRDLRLAVAHERGDLLIGALAGYADWNLPQSRVLLAILHEVIVEEALLREGYPHLAAVPLSAGAQNGIAHLLATQESMIAVTGWPDASSSAFHRSSVRALPYW